MRRVARRLALAASGALVVLVFGVLPWWLGGVATTRRFTFRDRENAGLTPASFKLAHQDVAFQAGDGVALKGWWVPAPDAKGTVVLVHGLNRSRIEMVRKVPFLHAAGWNALLFDLRHHGESGGEVSSFGWFERADVKAAADFVRTRAAGPLVHWGVSLGGATALLAAAEDDDVDGLVCDSTFRSLRDTVRHHVRLARASRWWLRAVPPWPLTDEVIFWIGRRGGFDPAAVDVKAHAPRLRGRPSLFVCNSGDVRMPPEIAHELKAEAGPESKVLVVPGRTHGGAWREGGAAYQEAVRDLLVRAEKRHRNGATT